MFGWVTDYFLFLVPQTHSPNIYGKERKSRQQDVFIRIDLTPRPLSGLTLTVERGWECWD